MKKASSRVTDYIASEIRRGHLQLGDKLPSERELMVILEVGRSSVRESLNTFVDMEVLEKRMGIGVFVKKTELNHMVDNLLVSALLDPKTTAELVDFRLLLEVETAGRAAKLAAEKELGMMEEALAIHLKAIESGSSTIEADVLFHKAILLASKNSILIKVYSSISDLLDSFKRDLMRAESKQSSLQHHIRIHQAIKNRDEKQAKAAMQAHLEDVAARYNSLQKIQEQPVINAFSIMQNSRK